MSDKININKKYTRTSSSNLTELSTSLGKEFTESHIKTLEISVDDEGEWNFYRRNMDETITNKFRLGQTFYYVDDFGQNVVGVVTMDQNKFIFQGSVEDDENENSPNFIIIWEFSSDKIVQTTSVIWSIGITGLFVESKEIFEPDYEIIYRGEFRTKLRPFIDTKLPQNLVSLPEKSPAPLDWCSCIQNDDTDDKEGEDNVKDMFCAVHGECDECEKTNEFCDCDWFYDEHFCRSCGVTLWQCECNHVVELMDKLYEF